MSVSLALGKTAAWVTANMTFPQLALYHKRIRAERFDDFELQARLVWMVANGWKRPEASEKPIDHLKDLGVMEDTV